MRRFDNKVIESGNKINGSFVARKSRCITSPATGILVSHYSGLIVAEMFAATIETVTTLDLRFFFEY